MIDFRPRIRGVFSDRNKISYINLLINKNILDECTKNQIINIFDEIIEFCAKKKMLDNFYEYIYKSIFIVTSDDIPNNRRKIIFDGIRSVWNCDEIFLFLESIVEWLNKNIYKDFSSIFNNLFEKECIGYRFINGKIINIIDEVEINEIVQALDSNYLACKKCIIKSSEFLYDRVKPDYQNSVKESILAIEAMCNIMLNSNKFTLGDALNRLEKNGYKIHGAMKEAFSSLYGYTSDKSGIRHNKGIDENTTFEEAKFMLVSCSAFLNYLIQVYEKKK